MPTLRVLLAFLLLCPAPAECRGPKREQFKWTELNSRITGRTIEFVLPDGTRIKGKVVAVAPDQLRMKVDQSSNPASHPKGEQSIPAQSLSLLRVHERGKMWRIICTAGTPFLLIGALAAAHVEPPESGASGGGIFAGGFFALIAGGYFLGRSLDKKVTEIEIVQ